MSFALIVIVSYLACTSLIALRSRRQPPTSNDLLNATGTVSTPVATLSFLAANCGALELIGLSGVAARYGVQAFHFYWIGAIPALIFVSFVMLPLYEKAGVRSVPEFLERRFGRRVRLLNACSLLVSTCLSAGVSLYALAQVLQVVGGWSFRSSVIGIALVVLLNVLTGGFRGTMRTEVLHFFLMIAGLLPVLLLLQRQTGAWMAAPGTATHVWNMTPLFSNHAPVDLFGVVAGLGLVIGPAYWATDFLMMQRALSARSPSAARRVPLYAGFGKLLFGFLVVLPAMRVASLHAPVQGTLDQTAAVVMRTFYGRHFFVLGMVAIIAGLMTGVTANVSAFASLWTQEIYRPSLRPGRSEQHYIRTGRAAGGLCVALSFAGAWGVLMFESLSQFLLTILSLTLVPFFAVILIAITARGCSEKKVVGCILAGVAIGLFLHEAYALQWLHAGSQLNANFRVAVVVFATTFGSSLACSRPSSESSRPGSAGTLAWIGASISSPLYLLAAVLLSCCVLCNAIWY